MTKQFCKNGHDTFVSGRNNAGACTVCGKMHPRNNSRTVASKKRHATYRQTPEGKYSNYKGNAKRRGLSFELTFEEFMSFWKKPCIAGCKIDTIGLDRIDNTKGYTLSNLRPMCWKHNAWKSGWSDREIIDFANALV